MGGNYTYYKVLGCFKRKFKMREWQPPPDVRDAFRQYTGGTDHMTADQLLEFLLDDGRAMSDAEEIMKTVYHDHRRGFTLEDFFEFLFKVDVNGPIISQVHHDMTAPLHHYFIYTGHNSYLTGNQLNSDCSEIPIIKSLENGVRGIELDLWPDKDNIHVVHGRTLTTPVSLMKCLESIKDHAFIKSPYPVIITLEDHLTPELQAKVAEMATRVFGDMLYVPDSYYMEEFPSPAMLKYKIILSTKPPKEYAGGSNNKKNDFGETQEMYSSENSQLLSEASDPTPEPEDYDKRGSGEDDEDIDAFQEKSGNLEAPEYKRLIAIHAGKAKKGLRQALRNGSYNFHRLSLSEQRLQKAAKLYAPDVVRFTQKNILRVYPKGTRVSSTNYRPTKSWMHGAQMVAFNMQGYGRSLWTMQGLFRSNGNCGYVKKPDLLMQRGPDDKVFDPGQTLPVKTTLKVSVYMGDGWNRDFSPTHFSTYSPPDFYTKLYILGVPVDVANEKTKEIKDDWTPYWDEEFAFPLTVPELALLRIVVKERDKSKKNGNFGGQTCLPVSELRSGIRAVPLYDKKGQQYKSVRLLMRFLFE